MVQEHAQPVLALYHLAAHPGDRHCLAEQGLRRGSAKRHDEVGPGQREFLVQPPAAGLNLAGIGLRMNAPLAARLEREHGHSFMVCSFEPVRHVI